MFVDGYIQSLLGLIIQCVLHKIITTNIDYNNMDASKVRDKSTRDYMNNKKTNTLTSNATVIQASKELKKVSQSPYFGIGRGNDSDNESGDNGSVENPLMKCKDVLPSHENWNYDEEPPPSKSAKNKTAILVKCGCPTAGGWVDKKSKNGRGKVSVGIFIFFFMEVD